MRAHHRTEEVVGVLDGGDPVPHRLVHGVFERPAARQRRSHLGAEKVHPKHVEGLALDVDLTHVDDTFHTHERGGRRCRNTVLTGPGFGDEAILAHPLGQQRLTEHVVDLVGSGVVQILSLEQHPETELG